MCGIAGIFETARVLQDADRAVLTRLLQAQTHRGPDADGSYCGDYVALGQRRLSIVDLSEAGRQPMYNESGDVILVFNGEIYNFQDLRPELVSRGHQFRSHTDSEVLLHGYEEWGIEGLLERVAGMFAFAIADLRRAGEPLLLLARDRLGIKPLYYTSEGQRLVFASEVKAIAFAEERDWQTDPEALIGFLAQGSVPSPHTILRGISSLPPASYLAVTRSSRKLRQYWDLTYGASNDWQERLPGLLKEVVRQHLIADVPVGLFLSGGVDSTALAALVSRTHPSALTSLTVTFGEQEFNEARESQAAADRFGTRHHEIRVGKQQFLASIPNFLASIDQPSSDGFNTYIVSQAAKQTGLKVVLSGLGGDELFFGYLHYRKLSSQRMWSAIQEMPPLARRLAATLPGWYGRALGQEKWQRFGYLSSKNLPKAQYYLFRGFYPESQIAELMRTSRLHVRETWENMGALEPAAGIGASRQFNYYELKRYLHDQLLRDSDVFSMAHSLELRVPFLDHRLVELVAQIPPERQLAGDMNKPRLVEAVGDEMVTQLARNPKRGFTFPFAVWMREAAADIEPLALAGRAVDPEGARRLWGQFRQGRLHWSRAWALVVAESVCARAGRMNGIAR